MAVKKKTELGPKAKLMKKNVDQLKRQAKKLKIQGYSTKKKEQLVNSIMMAEARAKRKPGTKRKKAAAKKPMAGTASMKRMVKKRGAMPNRVMRKPVAMHASRRPHKMMADYNGWSNYETWLCNLWYGDSLPMIQEEQEINSENFQDPVYEMSQILESMVDEDVEVTVGRNSGFIADAVNGFVRNINYYEIAENQYEE